MRLCFPLVIFALASCKGDELTPFIAWSNNDVLSGMSTETNIKTLTTDLVQCGVARADLVLLFVSRKLSFDDIAHAGNVFSTIASSNTDSLRNLRETVESSRSHYWTGYKSNNGDSWIAHFANKMKLEIQHIKDRDAVDALVNNWHGMVVVDLQSDDIKEHDAVIKSVMDKIQELELDYVAVYTGIAHHGNKEHIKHPRNVPSSASQFSTVKKDNVAVGGSSGSLCSIGGVFNTTIGDSPSPCLLFCMRKNVTFVPNVNNSAINCSLSTPFNFSWCCDAELNRTSNCGNESYPSVTLHYVVENVTETNSSFSNICNQKLFGEQMFPPRPEKKRFRNARPQLLVFLKFMFPNNVTDPNSWNVLVNATYSYVWLKEAEVERKNAPEDDKQKNGILTYSSIAERQNPDENLYLPFTVNFGLSYSCSSNEYNTYSVELNKSANGSSLTIHGIQVQPYNVSSNEFLTSDDCSGYFTATTWMGIITMGILLLFLYGSMMATFSMTSIDGFEDTREETIKIDKLH